MENMLKKIIMISLGGLLLYISIVFIINNKEAKQLQNNNIVNSAINNKVFKDKVKIVKLIESKTNDNKVQTINQDSSIEEAVNVEKLEENIKLLEQLLN